MKMTMHIDEALLDRVIKIHGCASKTEAVDLALREMERRHLLRAYADKGLGFSAAELREGVEVGYDVVAARSAGGRRKDGRRRSG